MAIPLLPIGIGVSALYLATRKKKAPTFFDGIDEMIANGEIEFDEFNQVVEIPFEWSGSVIREPDMVSKCEEYAKMQYEKSCEHIPKITAQVEQYERTVKAFQDSSGRYNMFKDIIGSVPCYIYKHSSMIEFYNLMKDYGVVFRAYQSLGEINSAIKGLLNRVSAANSGFAKCFEDDFKAAMKIAENYNNSETMISIVNCQRAIYNQAMSGSIEGILYYYSTFKKCVEMNSRISKANIELKRFKSNKGDAGFKANSLFKSYIGILAELDINCPYSIHHKGNGFNNEYFLYRPDGSKMTGKFGIGFTDTDDFQAMMNHSSNSDYIKVLSDIFINADSATKNPEERLSNFLTWCLTAYYVQKNWTYSDKKNRDDINATYCDGWTSKYTVRYIQMGVKAYDIPPEATVKDYSPIDETTDDRYFVYLVNAGCGSLIPLIKQIRKLQVEATAI